MNVETGRVETALCRITYSEVHYVRYREEDRLP
jgi:hypothetical protein